MLSAASTIPYGYTSTCTLTDYFVRDSSLRQDVSPKGYDILKPKLGFTTVIGAALGTPNPRFCTVAKMSRWFLKINDVAGNYIRQLSDGLMSLTTGISHLAIILAIGEAFNTATKDQN